MQIEREETRQEIPEEKDGDFGENSYRVGLSWQPQPEAHYYVSWSDSFSPTADLYQLTVAPLPAERSQVAAREISEQAFLLGSIYDSRGADGVRAELLGQAQSREHAYLNSWRAVMCRALGESDWFCNGGFRGT